MNTETTTDLFKEASRIAKRFKAAQFEPYEAGLSSEESAVLKDVARVMDALTPLLSCNIKDDSFFRVLNYSIMEYMKQNGYEHRISIANRRTFRKVKQ